MMILSLVRCVGGISRVFPYLLSPTQASVIVHPSESDKIEKYAFDI